MSNIYSLRLILLILLYSYIVDSKELVSNSVLLLNQNNGSIEISKALKEKVTLGTVVSNSSANNGEREILMGAENKTNNHTISLTAPIDIEKRKVVKKLLEVDQEPHINKTTNQGVDENLVAHNNNIVNVNEQKTALKSHTMGNNSKHETNKAIEKTDSLIIKQSKPDEIRNNNGELWPKINNNIDNTGNSKSIHNAAEKQSKKVLDVVDKKADDTTVDAFKNPVVTQEDQPILSDKKLNLQPHQTEIISEATKQPSSHSNVIFIIAIVAFVFFLIVHKRNKILGLIVEGRSGRRSSMNQRATNVRYRRLSTNDDTEDRTFTS